ncbi:MAG TPA: helix-turn-helix transcriptional regulator [Pirellulales bacterium]|nr:helix-turn-helix transcriptional regulator [Pirellulales bacterium]
MTATQCLSRLNARRRELGMSIAALAQRSGVSKATLQRMLSGTQKSADLEHVVAIAAALGMTIDLTPQASSSEFRRAAAAEKASKLVGMVQGTSALEGQAITSPESRRDLVDLAVETLLGGSRRRLWTD